ncbi:MAG TPA: SCO family protein [Candidatus Baltobacteraceae bacterium]|nr:SCO family protein [Candidatus Baltobacteraceae bacterium]
MLGRIRASAFAILAAIALAPPALAARMPQLIDQNGHAFTFQTLRGTPLIVTFIAAHCTQACPLVNAQFAQAAQRFAHAHTHVRLLTITLDPEHDSLRDMHDIARRFNADPRTWIVAGGKRADVHAIMSAFGVVAQRGRKGYADVHTTFVYYIDAGGNVRKTILASTALTDQLVEMAR